MVHKKILEILFIPRWYPSEANPVNGIFVREHANAVQLFNNVTVLYSEQISETNKHLLGRSLYKIISDSNEGGIRTIRSLYNRSIFPNISFIYYLLSIFSAFRYLLKKKYKPDIIHAHIFEAGVPAVILGKLYKIPTAITEHWTIFPSKTLTSARKFLARFAMNNSNIIFPVSNNLMESIQYYNIKNKFSVIPNCIDISIFQYSKENTNGNKIKLLCVALLAPKKGINFLIEAIDIIRNNSNLDITLDIIGDGPNRIEYENKTKILDLQSQIKFLGFKNKIKIAKAMKTSDIFILPSLVENLPCVIIEALVSGLPVIATNVGGVSEMINQNNGILVPPKDVNLLSQAIINMIKNLKQYNRKLITEQASQKYGYTAIGKEFDTVYGDLLNAQR